MTPGLGFALGAMACFGVSDLIYKRGTAAGIKAGEFLIAQASIFCPGVTLYAWATGNLVLERAALWGALAGAFLFVALYNFTRSLQGGAVSTNAPIFRLNFTITAALAPAAYQPAQTQPATLVGTASTLDLAAVAPLRWLAQGSTLGVPITVEALDMGVPQANVNLRFVVTNGTATLSSSTATTNGAGMASVAAQVTNFSATVQVSACVTPAGSPCLTDQR